MAVAESGASACYARRATEKEKQMTQIHLRDGSAIAHLRRASIYLALAVLFALALAAAAKVMQG